MAGLWRWASLGLLLGCSGARGQAGIGVELHAPGRDRGVAIPVSTADELRWMAARAGVIFTGQVIAVSRQDAAGFVDVRFRVDQGLRGCPTTGAYVLREWAGLWSANPERYRVGQRMLMLLTTRGPSGMSAPVGGMAGAIPLVATATQPLLRGMAEAPPEDGTSAASAAVDLRWVQARAVRGVAAGPGSAQSPLRTVPADAVDSVPGGAAVVEWIGPIAPLYSASQSEQATMVVSLASVLALLRGAGSVGGVSYVQR